MTRDLERRSGHRRVASTDRRPERFFAALVAGWKVSLLCARTGKGWAAGLAATVYAAMAGGDSFQFTMVARAPAGRSGHPTQDDFFCEWRDGR